MQMHCRLVLKLQTAASEEAIKRYSLHHIVFFVSAEQMSTPRPCSKVGTMSACARVQEIKINGFEFVIKQTSKGSLYLLTERNAQNILP